MGPAIFFDCSVRAKHDDISTTDPSATGFFFEFKDAETEDAFEAGTVLRSWPTMRARTLLVSPSR
jgi:hypothetical protein